MSKYLLLILSLCVIHCNLHSVPVENGLLAYYDFNNNFNDVSANSYDAIAYNGVTRTSTGGFQNSGAISLDGIDDYLKVSNIPLNTNAGGSNTVSFWMNWKGGNSEMPVGFYYQDLYFCNGYFGFNSANGDLTGISASGLAGQWLHVAAVFYNGAPSPSTHALYINGVKQNIQLLMSSPNYYAMPDYFYMGTWNPQGYYFEGMLDEMMIFNRALTASEVTSLYTNIPQQPTVPEPSSFLLVSLFLFGCRALSRSRKAK